jgi:GT2 family glycosyltransferase
LALKNTYSFHAEIDYLYFGENLGSARGHNTLAQGASADFLMILNPDVVIGPRTLERMLEPFSSDGVGMTEARQLPIEHPKDYDPVTGETGWATTACAITRRSLFESIGGFDAESFFLYCDDVDYSWMVREAGKRVIYLPQATVFHDKRLSPQGRWIPSSAEVYFSAQASLMMMHKWSFSESLEKVLEIFQNGSKEQKAAVEHFLKRREAGTLCKPRDPDHKVGYLDKQHFYTKHRYPL